MRQLKQTAGAAAFLASSTLSLSVLMVSRLRTGGRERKQSFAPVPHLIAKKQTPPESTTAYDGAWEFFVGGGTAIFDCNGDRRPDLFIAGGKNRAQLFENQSPTAGALKFNSVGSGLSDKQAGNVLGAYPLDFNNDDILDLVLLRLGENLLLEGKGDCKFEVANRALGF